MLVSLLYLAQGRHTPRHRAWRPAAAFTADPAPRPAPRGDHLDAPRSTPREVDPIGYKPSRLANLGPSPSALGSLDASGAPRSRPGLVRLVRGKSVVALTGAGVSTESGIPDYRSPEALARPRKPVQGPEFARSEAVRQRYWARSAFGWRRVRDATPAPDILALAGLEEAGVVAHVVTQNVDRLHTRAGSRRVIELHGAPGGSRPPRLRPDRGARRAPGPDRGREPGLADPGGGRRPDRDAELTPEAALPGSRSPAGASSAAASSSRASSSSETTCRDRSWTKPSRGHGRRGPLAAVVGTSLHVFSGYRFLRRAVDAGTGGDREPRAGAGRGEERRPQGRGGARGRPSKRSLPIFGRAGAPFARAAYGKGRLERQPPAAFRSSCAHVAFPDLFADWCSSRSRATRVPRRHPLRSRRPLPTSRPRRPWRLPIPPPSSTSASPSPATSSAPPRAPRSSPVSSPSSARRLVRRSTAQGREATQALLNGRFVGLPSDAVTVYVFCARAPYEAYCARRLGHECPSPLGFYEKTTREVFVNVEPGLGTVTHELVHPIAQQRFSPRPRTGWARGSRRSSSSRACLDPGRFVGRATRAGSG